MALCIPHSIFHLARLLYARPETFGPYYIEGRDRGSGLRGSSYPCRWMYSPANLPTTVSILHGSELEKLQIRILVWCTN